MNQQFFFSILLIILYFIPSQGAAQNPSSYASLSGNRNAPQIYYEHHIIPQGDAGSILAVSFRIEYDFLTFKKEMVNKTERYSSSLRASIELFEGDSDTFLADEYWYGSVETSEYEETRERSKFLSGYIQIPLPRSGSFSYVMRVKQEHSKKELSSKRISFSVPEQPEFEVYFLEHERSDSTFSLLNFGEKVLFGKDYVLGIWTTLTQKDSISISLSELGGEGLEENPESTTVFDTKLSFHIHANEVLPQLSDSLQPTLKVIPSSSGGSFYLVSIPNKSFKNALHLLSISTPDSTLYEKKIQNYWHNIPISLLNLDTALDMLRFMVSEEKLKKMKEGDQTQKIDAFESFWNSKDPTPKTEYNELMTVYYQRIDQAYQEFSTPTTQGFDTDMGKVFILYGEPKNKQRVYPSNNRVVESWSYPNRTFTFQAQSGFGDFKLVTNQK